MTRSKLIPFITAAVLHVPMCPQAAAQSLNWVHQPTGITPTGPQADVAIGFTGPWVNVFYEQSTAQGAEIRGVRQFPAPNPNNNTQYIPYPAPLAAFPGNVQVDLSAISRPASAPTPWPDFAFLARCPSDPSISQLVQIRAATVEPDHTFGIEAAAFRPNGDLVTFRASDLLGLPQPVDGLVGAGATDLDVALVDTRLNPQNQTYDIRYHQTAFGDGHFLPHVVVASVPDLNPSAVDFVMTASGLPYVVYADPGRREVIARQFDPKENHWTSTVLHKFGDVDPDWIRIDSRDDRVAATWAAPNPNNPNAHDLYVAQKIEEWETSLVCSGCVGNPEQLDITIDPGGFPVIAYVSPANQIMVAYDPPSPEPALPGDINVDGAVDRSDVALMALNFGDAGFSIDPLTDLDGDRRVLLADLAIMQANLGQSLSAPSPAASAVAAIPEPSTIWLLVIAALTATARAKFSSACE